MYKFNIERKTQQQQMMSSGVGGVPPGSAIVYNSNMPVPIRSRTYNRFQDNQSKILGVTLIIIGFLCIIFNGVAIGMADNSYEYSAMVAYIGHGIWCGALFIITGGFGIGAGVKKTKCLIVTFMVMCIISAMITITLLTLGIIGACAAAEDCVYNYDGYGYGYGYTYPYYRAPCVKMNDYEVIVSMESMMAILGLLAGICAIWGSALCCGSGVCCCCTHSTPIIAQRPSYNFPNGGQIVYLNQSQSGQNFFVQQQQQSMFPYTQGMMAPPYVATYAQSGWIMPPPTDSNDPLIGQAPPSYSAGLQVTSAQSQPTERGKF